MNRVRGLAGWGQHATLLYRSPRPKQCGAFFFSHSHKLVSLRGCFRKISEEEMG